MKINEEVLSPIVYFAALAIDAEMWDESTRARQIYNMLQSCEARRVINFSYEQFCAMCLAVECQILTLADDGEAEIKKMEAKRSAFNLN